MSSSGTVGSINVSDGGVPKRPTRFARITKYGLDGDRQRDLRYHGGPDRAVCVYSLELIEQLRNEGHPIEPGTIGENLTLVGVDWALLSSGVHLTVGAARLEVTRPAIPCKNIAASFVDGEFIRISEKLRPGWSRWYCRVLDEGDVFVGDVVALSLHSGGDG